MRWIIRAILLLVILGVGLVATVLMLPGDRIAKLAADQISNITGRAVTMSGDTKVSFYPVLGVSTGAVTIANADWSDQGPMFAADSLKVGVEPQALWGGDIRITGFEAQSPTVRLERAADGRVNWELGVEGVAPSGLSESADETATAAQSARLALTLDRALIGNATFIFDDHATGERTEMTGMRFDLQWPEYEGRATFDATLRPADESVQLAGYLDRVGDFIDGAVSDVSATITVPDGEIAFLGRASADGQADGKLTAKIADTDAVMAALGQAPANMPAGFGRSVDASMQVTFTKDQNLSLRDLLLDLGGNRLTGAVDVAMAGDTPTVTARLDAGALDLSSLGGDGSGADGADGADSGDQSTGWSTAPIDASALAMANADVAFTASSIDLGDLQLGSTQTRLKLEQSRMVFELQDVRAYEGAITGQFVLNNRSGLSVGGNLDVKGIDMKGFLTDAAGIDRFSGAADAKLNFLGVGESQHAIMNSLSGDGSVQTGRGVIDGFDLDRLMRSGNLTGGTTIFDTMGATFTMNGGRLYNDDLRMELPLAKADGEGTIGIGTRDIDYLFTPKLLEGENTSGLAIPVRIRGSWDNPKIQPDLEKALEMNLSAQREKLEEQAEDGLRRAVGSGLGVDVEDGQDLEDVLKDAIEDEALKGLKGLFD